MKPSYLFVSVDYLYGSLRTEAASSKRRCTSIMAYDTDDCKDVFGGVLSPTKMRCPSCCTYGCRNSNRSGADARSQTERSCATAIDG